MPAIANAVYDAVGVRIDEVPITPSKVLRALNKKAAGRDARTGPGDFPEIEWPQAIFVLPPDEGGDGKASNKPRTQTGGEDAHHGQGDLIMMRLPPFRFYSPASISEAAKILAEEGPEARLLAGGTALLPGMKRGQQQPKTLVSLRRIESLRQFSNGSGLTLGAGTDADRHR